jgi:hypothetical protein
MEQIGLNAMQFFCHTTIEILTEDHAEPCVQLIDIAACLNAFVVFAHTFATQQAGASGVAGSCVDPHGLTSLEGKGGDYHASRD